MPAVQAIWNSTLVLFKKILITEIKGVLTGYPVALLYIIL